MNGWLDELDDADPVYEYSATPESATGIGLTEAPRGALGHWIDIKDSKISRYQVITPTSWNASPGDIAFDRGTQTSVHQLGLSESLEMMEATRAEPPQVVILGVEPKEIDWGLEISAELQEKVPQMIALVKEEIANLH